MSEPAVPLARVAYHHGHLRDALVEAGLELTRAGGSSALVLREVTRRVGVSPNAAYRHFADREQLLEAVSKQIQADMVERMRTASSHRPPGAAPPARDLLRAVGLGYVRFALAEPGWFEVAFPGPGRDHGVHLAPSPDDPLPAPLALLVTALDGLVAEGLLPPGDRAGAEWPCWSAVHGFADLALYGPLRGQPVEVVQAAAERTVDAIIAGLLGSPTGEVSAD